MIEKMILKPDETIEELVAAAMATIAEMKKDPATFWERHEREAIQLQRRVAFQDGGEQAQSQSPEGRLKSLREELRANSADPEARLRLNTEISEILEKQARDDKEFFDAAYLQGGYTSAMLQNLMEARSEQGAV